MAYHICLGWCRCLTVSPSQQSSWNSVLYLFGLPSMHGNISLPSSNKMAHHICLSWCPTLTMCPAYYTVQYRIYTDYSIFFCSLLRTTVLVNRLIISSPLTFTVICNSRLSNSKLITYNLQLSRDRARSPSVRRSTFPHTDWQCLKLNQSAITIPSQIGLLLTFHPTQTCFITRVVWNEIAWKHFLEQGTGMGKFLLRSFLGFELSKIHTQITVW